MNIRFAITALVFLVFMIPVKAQFRLPQFDIEAKGGYSLIDAGGNQSVDMASFSFFQAGLHLQFSQRLALGGFYNRSFGGETKYGSGDSRNEYPLSVLMYGVDLRLSAGRSARWRPYFGLVYGKAEFVQKTGSYNLAATSNMMGANLGIMKLFGRNFYWNILEVSARVFDRIYWLEADFSLEAKTGFTYNIRIKNK